MTSLRGTGVAAVGILWTTVAIGMGRTGLGLAEPRTISYLGTDPQSASLFRAGLILATLLLVAFAWAVNRRLARRRTGFLTVFLVGMAGQAVVATVSVAGHGTSHDIHTTAGIILGLSLPVLMWRFAAAQPAGAWRKTSYAMMWVSVVSTVVGIALSQVRRAGIAEVVPAVAFHLWIVLVTVRWPAWHRAPAEEALGCDGPTSKYPLASRASR